MCTPACVSLRRFGFEVGWGDNAFRIRVVNSGKMRRRRRALSYILSVVIMILITTSLATVVLLWGLNEVSTSRSSFSSSIRARTDRVQEHFTVEDVRFNSTHLRVYLRNTGAIQIVVDQVYVNHQVGTIASSSSSSGGTKLSLGVQALGWVDVARPSAVTLTSGQTYTVNVATTRGSTVAEYWTY